MKNKVGPDEAIFGFHGSLSQGRLIGLCTTLVSALYNVFLTGTFYTGFLTVCGMSISDAGIITYIPLLASCFSLFSPFIFERIKRRKWILLGARLLHFSLYILATTVMPSFVSDPTERLRWFVAILFVASAISALISPALTAWSYPFLPTNNEKRIRYLSLIQLSSVIMSAGTTILSSVLADRLAGSENQASFIFSLRYIAFGLGMLELLLQVFLKEFPYPKGEKLRLRSLLTLPFRARKFLYCSLFMFIWNFTVSIDAGLWNYHLMNHLNFSYTLINMPSVAYSILFLITRPVWVKIVQRKSWIKTLGITIFVAGFTEIYSSLMDARLAALFLPVALWTNIWNCGRNIAYSNILYMNLPKEKTTVYIAFNTVGCQLFAFLGSFSGTCLSAIGGDTPFSFFGLQMYTVQFTIMVRAVMFFLMGGFCIRHWRVLSTAEEIERIDAKKG